MKTKQRSKRRENLAGMKFGEWTALYEDDGNRAKYFCQCSCGVIQSKFKCSLKSGRSKRCLACWDKNNRKTQTGYSKRANDAYRTYLNAATQRGIKFAITMDEFERITKQDCFYCGSPPALRKSGHTMNGIDRVDSSSGYEQGNVVPCCITCNIMKNTMSLDSFREHIKKVYLRIQ